MVFFSLWYFYTQANCCSRRVILGALQVEFTLWNVSTAWLFCHIATILPNAFHSCLLGLNCISVVRNVTREGALNIRSHLPRLSNKSASLQTSVRSTASRTRTMTKKISKLHITHTHLSQWTPPFSISNCLRGLHYSDPVSPCYCVVKAVWSPRIRRLCPNFIRFSRNVVKTIWEQRICQVSFL